ncbi:MAG: 1-acyl-sn-glycerol-3-phosphate acyltransferase [Acholeplasmatales bacterium]|nr:MAG: 1-acyl-sn-glycerol-3-phosphate acyltransferase [Acholeplasmatales bacterium]
MATLLFILGTLFMALATIFGFDLTELNALNAFLWVLITLVAAVVSFGGVWVFMGLFVLVVRNENPHGVWRHRIINSIVTLFVRLLNVKITLTGKENIPDKGETFVLYSNHQVIFDPLFIKPLFKHHPLVFVAKEEAFDWFVLGHWLKRMGYISISPQADRSAAESIIKGIRLLGEGIPMAIYPEGKRSFSNTMLPFKPGAFKLATKPKADILVAAIYDFTTIFKGWPFKRAKAYVHIFPKLTYETYKDMNTNQLAEHVRSMIQSQLDTYASLSK